MVGKSQIKFIKSLQQKKYRALHKLFVVEGVKTVKELLASRLKNYQVYVSDPSVLPPNTEGMTLVAEGDLKKMSSLTTPNKVLGVFHMPEEKEIDFSNWVVALDDVRDPGNLGTIIRLCDWFGIPTLLCSSATVDCYNPKTLQATMGSITRVNIVYANLHSVLQEVKVPVYGAFMEGKLVYGEKMPETGILVMGNEANGVSKSIEALVAKKISIPQFGTTATESLNVATATAILLNEIRRS
ncbi:RNA methyltransferase, TrmH family [Arenibacter nanhaiticus]|uniref:RNA methyltransferase, TrmH family n=1 Tax=Arenibacter nanhaiticus TaxID=558155 RepID=A0A1M6H948_9FLAO|nr:RNA methyltransferase [Arenibacter nanhaiticus]SHJ18716.1 RNA methyltransferase, TrmH family [Arenibacter nanhaiticus]